jgi:opacity protein-like surface antigen
MKTILRILGLGLLLFGQPRFLSAQDAVKCRDVLILRDGSRFHGQLTEMNGDSLLFHLYTGPNIRVYSPQVKRVIQRCKGRDFKKPYSFKEKGWYHHTQFNALVGQTYYNENQTGFQIQHSSGWMFNRLLGAGLGVGGDFFSPKSDSEVATYPIFAEARGYLSPRPVSLFYSVGGGWALTGHSKNSRWGYVDSWKGGWLAQAIVGYRLGNHFSVQAGIRLQQKYREWTSIWGSDSGKGSDSIFQKRLILGLGLLL